MQYNNSKNIIITYNRLGDFMALKGIVIDPGHGGTDPGAVSNNLKEKDYTLLISKYIYNSNSEVIISTRYYFTKLLNRYGYTVALL